MILDSYKFSEMLKYMTIKALPSLKMFNHIYLSIERLKQCSLSITYYRRREVSQKYKSYTKYFHSSHLLNAV